MHANIVVLPGDGIGPEVTAAAVEVLRAVAARYGHDFRFREHLIGGAAIDATGSPLPEATLAAARDAGAILLGYPEDAAGVTEAVRQKLDVTNQLDALRSGDWSGLRKLVD